MAERVGMGVVGAGSIGIRAALMHLSMDDVQNRQYLAAVCDPAPGRAKAAAETYGVRAPYESFEELLADRNVDAVTLCSPIGLHYEQGKMAIEAGKHVHFNKTMTTEVWEADDLIARAKAKGVHLVASPGMMLYPRNRRARKAVLEGRLGKLAWAAVGASIGGGHINESLRQGDDVLTNIDPTWYFKRPGGGPQYDVTVYALHNLTGIVGPAKRVTALSGLVVPVREFRGKQIDCDMDDNTVMLLDFGESFFGFVYGAVTGLIGGWAIPRIFGTQAAIIDYKIGDEELGREGDHYPHVTGQHQEMREHHVFEDMMQLVDWIREGKPSIASVEHARHVVDIIESGYRAAETGQTQALRTTFKPLTLEEIED
jgi:predicted dehydrogenase